MSSPVNALKNVFQPVNSKTTQKESAFISLLDSVSVISLLIKRTSTLHFFAKIVWIFSQPVNNQILRRVFF